MRARKLRESFEKEALVHLDALYGLALRLTHNEQEAEDLLQDAIVKAYRFYDQYEPGSNVKAWLFKVLTNTFYNRCRKTRNIQKVVIEAELGDHYDRFVSSATVNGRNAEDAILDRVAARELNEAIAELPPDFRLVLILCDVHEFSYREIADIIGRPVGTVMSRLYRARKMLQKRLYDYAVERGFIRPAKDDSSSGDTATATDLTEYRRQRGKK